MRDTIPMFNRSGEQAATTGFNESYGLCPTEDLAFAAWHEEFDPESGFPKSAVPGMLDA